MGLGLDRFCIERMGSLGVNEICEWQGWGPEGEEE